MPASTVPTLNRALVLCLLLASAVGAAGQVCGNANPGFDQGADGLDGWLDGSDEDPADVNRNGELRLRDADGGESVVRSAELPVSFDTVYALTFTGKTNLDTRHKAVVTIVYLDAGSDYLTREVVHNGSLDGSILRFERRPPLGAAFAVVELRNVSDSKDLTFDDVCLAPLGRFGATSSVSGQVFDDGNNNGRRDLSDTRLADVRLLLYRDNGDGVRNPNFDEELAATTSRADDQDYRFTGLASGDYYVVGYLLPTRYLSPSNVGQPAAIDSDFESQTFRGFSVGVSGMLALDGSGAVAAIDMGQAPSNLAAVTGYLWHDANGNLRFDEPRGNGLNGIKLRTYYSDGTPIDSTLTTYDPAGNPGFYIFNYVNPGSVYIELVPPAGTTYPARGLDNRFSDSDHRTADVDLRANRIVKDQSGVVLVSGTEVCDNGIDDDGDQRVDLADSDCSTCVLVEDVSCGDPLRYYVPPIWEMADASDTTFTGPNVLVLTTSSASANVRVYSPDGALDLTRVIVRGRPDTVPLAKFIGQTTRSAQVLADRGVVIESDQPLQAISFVDGYYNKSLTTLKGQQALGNKFRAGSQVYQYFADCDGDSLVFPADPLPLPIGSRREAHFVSVMATEEATRVTFTWDESRLTLADGLTSPHTVTLDRHQSYLVRDAYTNQTVSGLEVASDKAIVVTSGSQHTNVCQPGGLDAGIDQLVPECHVGTEYVVVKHAGHAAQHYAIVVPTLDGTEVFLDGATTARGRVDAGDWLRIALDGAPGDPHHIRTSAPAYVYHVSGISDNNEVGMALAAAVGDCKGDKYLSFPMARPRPKLRQDLSIVTPTTATGSLLLNGVDVTALSGAVTLPVPGRPDYTSILVGQEHLVAVNTLSGPDYFQAALLVGISGGSGTFGYLTSFAESIKVTEPGGDIPTPRYRLPRVCGGDGIDHTVGAESCGSVLAIVGASNNPDLGTVTLTGGLGFHYDAKSNAYGEETISLRIRDDNGLETMACIELFVCGANVAVDGVPADTTLSCGTAIPPAKLAVYQPECPLASAFTYADTETAGACPGERTVVRTWTARTDCGATLTRSTTYTFRDAIAPTFAGVPAEDRGCASEPFPSSAPTASDNCGGPVAVVYRVDTLVEAGTSYTRYTRTWTATDACDNSATAEQRVHRYADTLAALVIFDLDGGPSVRLRAGGRYDVATLPTRYQLRSAAGGADAEVRFAVSGAVTESSTDAAAAYAYPDDATPLAWGVGDYTIATDLRPFLGAGGAACASRSVAFRLVRRELCRDGLDNDGDGLVDGCDEECPGAIPAGRVTQN